MATAISDFRVSRNWTQAELAGQLGITRSALAAYESGRVQPNRDVVKRLSALGLSVVAEERAAYGLGPPKIPIGYPLARMRFAGEVPTGDWGDPLASEDFIEVEAQFEGPRRFAARVVGDSCFPALLPGDITIWESDLNPPYGVIVLAQRKGDHGCTVKQLTHDGTRPHLRPINPARREPSDGSGWGVIGRLIAVLRSSDAPRRTWYWEPGLRPEHLL